MSGRTPSAPSTDARRTRRRRLLSTLAVLAAVVGPGIWGTFAAYTATTSNNGNQISSGSVKIDQQAGYTSLYNVTNQGSGQATSGCARVTFSGSLRSAVRLYFSGGATNGTQYNLKVERGAGLTSPGASMSCVGFSAGSTVYDDDLGNFPTSYAAGLPGKASGSPFAQNDAVDYRFTITQKDDTALNAHTATMTSGAHSFTWDARSLTPYANEVLSTSGLQSYWRLGEPSGTTAYDAAGSTNATYQGGPTLGRPGLITGDNDSSTGLDGSDDAISAGDVYDFAGTAAFSVEGWIQPTAVNDAQYRRVVSKEVVDGGGRQGWDVLILASGAGGPRRLSFERWRDGSSHGVVSSTLASAGVRHQVVATYDGTSMKLYVDGSLEGSDSGASNSLIDSTAAMRIGGNASYTGDQLGGDVDDFSIYSRALGAAEVTAHYQRGIGN